MLINPNQFGINARPLTTVERRSVASAHAEASQISLFQPAAVAVPQAASLQGNLLANPQAATPQGLFGGGDTAQLFQMMMYLMVAMMQMMFGINAPALPEIPVQPQDNNNAVDNNRNNGGGRTNTGNNTDTGNRNRTNTDNNTDTGNRTNPGDNANKPGETPPSNGNKTFNAVTDDYRNLSSEERTKAGMNDRERAILHLWGRQNIGSGGIANEKNKDKSILLTVIDQAGYTFDPKTGKITDPATGKEVRPEDVPATFPPKDDKSAIIRSEEVKFAITAIQEDYKTDGKLSGRYMDSQFFDLYGDLTRQVGKDGKVIKEGVDLKARYGASLEEKYKSHPGATQALKLPSSAVDSAQWEKDLEAQSGLSGFDNSVLRFWGHDPLTNMNTGDNDGDRIDGDAMILTLLNDKSLDKGLVRNTDGSIKSNNDAEFLLQTDMADDGKVNGSSLEHSFLQTMDKLYGKSNVGATRENTMTHAIEKAQENGRTPEQVARDMTFGVQKAISDMGQFMKDHPVAVGAAGVGLAAASAVCPFLGGLAAGTAGVGMATRFLNGGSSSKTADQ